MILEVVLLVALDLIEVHGPNGQTAYVNIHEISTLRQPNATDLNQHFQKGTNCVIVTTNGKFLAVIERCSDLRNQLLEKGHAK